MPRTQGLNLLQIHQLFSYQLLLSHVFLHVEDLILHNQLTPRINRAFLGTDHVAIDANGIPAVLWKLPLILKLANPGFLCQPLRDLSPLPNIIEHGHVLRLI